MKKSIPAGNWSGDMVDITINESKGTVKVNGYILNIMTYGDDDNECMEVSVEGQQLCSGGKIGKEWYLTDGNIDRENECPYTAAAQMACNLL